MTKDNRPTPNSSPSNESFVSSDGEQSTPASSAADEDPTRSTTLNARLTKVQETERRHLAQILHNEIGQNVTAIGFNLDFIHSQLVAPSPNSEFIRTRLESALTLVEETTDRIRRLVAELRPPMLDTYGLIEALSWYADTLSQQNHLKINVQEAYFAPRLPTWIENSLFRIVQEALSNSINHAQATHISVDIEADASTVRLTITDDGVGFDAEQQKNLPENFGLQTMVERAKSINGSCRINSRSNQGTQVIVEVPR